MAEEKEMLLFWLSDIDSLEIRRVWDPRNGHSLPAPSGPGHWAYDYSRNVWVGPFQTYDQARAFKLSVPVKEGAHG